MADHEPILDELFLDDFMGSLQGLLEEFGNSRARTKPKKKGFILTTPYREIRITFEVTKLLRPTEEDAPKQAPRAEAVQGSLL